MKRQEGLATMQKCAFLLTTMSLGNNHLIFMGGGGQEDFSKPENFFFCLFLEQEHFFAGPSELISLNRVGGGGVYTSFFQRAKYFLFIMQKFIPNSQSIM